MHRKARARSPRSASPSSRAGKGMTESHPFVSEQRERLAEAVRHVIDAVLTVEDATEEQLGTAADMTEAVARHLGREPHDDDRGVRRRSETGHDGYLPRSPL